MAEPGQYILKASCASRQGTVARLSTFLADRRCYIDEMQQFDDVLTQRFHRRCAFHPDESRTPPLDEMRRQFVSVGQSEEMEWSMHDSRSRMRVMLMVSKHDHCLEDLLYRWRTGELPMDIPLVVSNHPDLRARVEREGLRYEHLAVTPGNKRAQEQRRLGLIGEAHCELVVLARYMQILADEICESAALHIGPVTGQLVELPFI